MDDGFTLVLIYSPTCPFCHKIMGTNGEGNSPWEELQKLWGYPSRTLNISIPKELKEAEPLMGMDGGVPQVCLLKNGRLISKAIGYMPTSKLMQRLGAGLTASVPQAHYVA